MAIPSFEGKPCIMGGSFSPEVEAKLNEKWLPTAASESLLSFFDNLYDMHWFDAEEGIHPDWHLIWSHAIRNPEPSPEKKSHQDGEPAKVSHGHDQSVREFGWLRNRLVELLDRHELPQDWRDFLMEYPIWQAAAHKDVDDSELIQIGRQNRTRLIADLGTLAFRVRNHAISLLYPVMWVVLIEMLDEKLPVRSIPELISFLRVFHERLVSHRDIDGSDIWLEYTRTVLLNARVAISEYLPPESRQPIFRKKPTSLHDAEIQLIDLIDDLTRINAKLSMPQTPNTDGTDKHKRPAAPVTRRGISLRNAAMLANEDEAIAAKLTKKRWHSNRDPKLPTPIGKAANHSQTDLYDPAELLNFIELVDQDSAPRFREGYSDRLQTVSKQPSEPSAK